MAEDIRGGQDAAGGADDPWAPPERKVSMDKPPAAPPLPGEPPVGGTLPSFHDHRTMGGAMPPTPGFAPLGSGMPGGGPGPAGAAPGPVDGGFPVPPPPIAPADPGASAYATPAGYGYPAPPGYAGYGWPGMPAPPRNGLGVAAMVLGILAVCLFCMYGVVSLILGILAVIFGIKGRKRVEAGEADNRGQALAGFILGIVGIVLGVAVIVLMVIGITMAINHAPSSDDPYVGNALSVSAPALFHD
ncbi:DUF4190 domain-containing protein [Streptomyces sp. NPDC002573]|uniref:DUF4190 domain-containing protein n=1 Tax=Streptomyces sp. NPDC002573 TaxID=3364651 RepID=UPI0036791243